MSLRPNLTSPFSKTAAVWRKLNALKPLSQSQSKRIEDLSERIDTVAAGAVLLNEGGAQLRQSFILSGWACRQRLLPDGRRQILSLLLPGDAIGFCVDVSPLATSCAVALTKVALATADPPAGACVSPTSQLAHDPDDFAEHMRLSACLDEGLLLDHVVRLGRQTAFERTAHLLLELHWRSTLTGKADDYRFTMPLTQEVLADFLGLSIVHVNRTLQQLRRERLIEMSGAHVSLIDAAQMALIACYQPPILLPQP